ncbi:hypothetical protein KFK09_004782 [Dendrobium nobile]|uniref:Reverse transcriptase domain-containing protein n=1 Tax=Dendrobium nobile TaxID=94219 RepID=A0A8T3BYQ8_DENNO|nr:hypothetical protein KFK09_004782 [Dendrobium nobile]
MLLFFRQAFLRLALEVRGALSCGTEIRFFLLRFSCNEDFDMVWSRGVWFLLGKSFVLQKWHPKFKPKKEDFLTVAIWVKIHDLPLACWNSEGISRIASKIGVPIAADNLTEQKTRLTFARICVLVDCNSTYPEEIKVSLDGDVVSLKVQYEWRPFPCAHFWCFKRLIESFKLDLVCVLENRIQVQSLKDQYFISSHSLFPNESSCHNFDLSQSGRIWIKWNPTRINFSPEVTTSQLISGTVFGAFFSPFKLTVIYAANSSLECKSLWADINMLAPPGHTPWALLGDFNCCRFASEKLGGTFLFKNYWTKLDSYWALLVDAIITPPEGNPLSHFCNTLRIIKRNIKNQSWVSSSCVSRHIDILHDKQKELLSSLHRDPSNLILNQTFKDNNINLARFTSMQASWIIQRAKVNWLKHGEYDLKFLYAKIRSRMGSKKSVVNLLTCNSQASRKDVISSIIHYFQDLYNPIPPSNVDWESIPIGTALPDVYASSIISFVTDEDIKFAIFSGSSTSAPGPDGFNFHFFKSGWHILGPTVCRAIRSFFTKGFLPKGVKSTALAIIPKHKNAANISEYRPIALCNVLYKIIAKIMAVRLKPVMSWIVKDNQAGFVNSRVSTDNILLASDILYYAGKRDGAKIFCFPSLFVSWIRACITDVNFSFVLNGALEGFFPSTAGLRQGCPLSPYLFCIVMDAFSNLLEARGFNGISYGNFSLTHLLYADDVLIFGEATISNCIILDYVLREFANSSGLVVNHGKSSIMFPKHLKNQTEICQALSIHSIANKITYLGIPLSFYRLNIADYLPLLDSLNKKLNGWKANLLSFAGRLQYLKFTIQNTIAYWIRGSILPKTVHKSFKKFSSRFLFYGDVNMAKKLHMISWDKICRPKSKGGLGIHSLNALQFAFNCTVIVRMYNNSSPLAHWLLYKYKSPWKPPLFSSSKLWKSICNTASQCKKCFQFEIYQNSPISLEWEYWCFNTTLENYSGTDEPNILPDIMLLELISGDCWELPAVIPPLLRLIFEKVNIFAGAGPSFLWRKGNCFKFKHYIHEFYNELPNCYWSSLLWHKKHILKHSVFGWLALVGGLKTADALRIRQISIPSKCSLCYLSDESVGHLFFECTFSFSILRGIIPGVEIFLLRPSILQLFDWIKSEFSGNAEILKFHKVAVCSIIYYTWKERNGRRFSGNSQCHTTVMINIKRILFEKVMHWKSANVLLDKL